MNRHGADDTSPPGRLGQIAESPGLMLAAGALTVLIGLLVLAWPGATVRVIAWLFAVQLVVCGVLQLVSAFSADRGPGGRVLFILLGALSILVGLLCLREPLQTAIVLGLLIGAMWVVQGVVGIAVALGGDGGTARGWAIASSALSVLGGVVVLVYPGTSLVVLTWLFGITLLVLGVVLIAQGVIAHRGRAPAVSVAPQT
ncbi:HdeD family acid-resistance protein [Pseudonocardia sp. DLS-67]